MWIIFNGKKTHIPQKIVLSELLKNYQIDPTLGGIAVALNGAVVPRLQWSSTNTNDGDKIDVIQAVQGG